MDGIVFFSALMRKNLLIFYFSKECQEKCSCPLMIMAPFPVCHPRIQSHEAPLVRFITKEQGTSLPVTTLSRGRRPLQERIRFINDRLFPQNFHSFGSTFLQYQLKADRLLKKCCLQAALQNSVKGIGYHLSSGAGANKALLWFRQMWWIP